MSSVPPTTGRSAAARPAGEATSRRQAIARTGRRSVPWAAALAAYVVLAVVATWPTATDLSGTVFGQPGDSTGNITLIRYRNDLGVGPLSNAATPDENAPFDLPLPGYISLPQLLTEGTTQVVSWATDEVVAYNLMILAGLALSAFAAFLLCLYVTRRWGAAFVAGIAFGFSPWILERAHGHVHMTHLWPLPLLALGLIMVRQRGTKGAWALTVAAFAAAAYTNTYVTLFAATIVAAFVAADLGAETISRSRARIRQAVARTCFVAAMVIGVLMPQAIVSLTQRDAIDGLLAGTRSASDLYVYGSRWWEWFIPSYRHPVFSDWTQPFLLDRMHESNFGETALYLGVSMIALAAVGAATAFLAWRRRREGNWVAVFAGTLVAAGLLVSQPRTIAPFGFDLPMPSYLLSEVVPPWRVYARLFTVVMLGVVLLAAFGIAWLLKRVPGRAAPVAVAALAAVVVFDLRIDSTAFPSEAPAVYHALAAQPGDDPRVEYPLARPVQPEHLHYIFYTRAAERPLMNGGRQGTLGSSIQDRLLDPSDPETARTLAALGVRWAVIHPYFYPEGAYPPPGPGFRHVGDYDRASLFEVVAEPPAVIAVPGDGFGLPETTSTGTEQWLESSAGKIALINSTDAIQPTRLRFSLGSFAVNRRVAITYGDRVLFDQAVFGTRDISLAVPAGQGVSMIEIETRPGPIAVGPLVGNDDPRSVTLRMSSITATTRDGDSFQLG